jgi:hypothetical protein
MEIKPVLIFATRTEWPTYLWATLTKIIEIALKHLSQTNTLAYFSPASMTEEEGYITLAPGAGEGPTDLHVTGTFRKQTRMSMG